MDAAPPAPAGAGAARLPLRCHRFKGKRPRWWQACVAPAFAGVLALLCYAYTVDVLRFEVGGAAGFLIDETATGRARHDYSAVGVALALRHCTPDDAWRPLVKFLTWVTIVFAFLIPAAHCACVLALYAAPLTVGLQSKVLAASDVLYGWSSLDVFVVSVIAAATQFGDVASSLAKDQCKDVDGLLETFFDSTLGGDAKCFSLSVDVLPGCFVLTWACLAHMLAGHLVGNVTAAAVAERVDARAALAARHPASLELVSKPRGDLAL